uniref:queuine tRNA-ribosyltransferase accessory subunit 2 isoform X1 n=2 Tax=Myxine glutinosa TaxID=7769 RepID=UPI00358E00AD
MRFEVRAVVDGARLGLLSGLGAKGASVETPACLVYSHVGCVPHLTSDLLASLADLPQCLYLPLPELAGHQDILEKNGDGISKFVGMPEYGTFVSQHDPMAPVPSGYNGHKFVSVWATGGRVQLTTARFLSLIEAMRPDCYVAMADILSDHKSIKPKFLQPGDHERTNVADPVQTGESVVDGLASVTIADNKVNGLSKASTLESQPTTQQTRRAQDRTLQFLDECLALQARSQALRDTSILAPVLGAGMASDVIMFVRKLAIKPISGFALLGRQSWPDELLTAVVTELPYDKLRMVCGIGEPSAVLDCVRRGVDLFDGHYPQLATACGYALTFYYPGLTAEPAQEVSTSEGDFSTYGINLNDKRYHSDFRPLVPGCTCCACQAHSRAYLHHLMCAHELLASTLLASHNVHHYMGFFAAIRKALASGRLNHFHHALNACGLAD